MQITGVLISKIDNLILSSFDIGLGILLKIDKRENGK